MYDIVSVLMTRDGFSHAEALAEKDFIIEELREAIDDGIDPAEYLMDEYGLEPDYLENLLFDGSLFS